MTNKLLSVEDTTPVDALISAVLREERERIVKIIEEVREVNCYFSGDALNRVQRKISEEK